MNSPEKIPIEQDLQDFANSPTIIARNYENIRQFEQAMGNDPSVFVQNIPHNEHSKMLDAPTEP